MIFFFTGKRLYGMIILVLQLIGIKLWKLLEAILHCSKVINAILTFDHVAIRVLAKHKTLERALEIVSAWLQCYHVNERQNYAVGEVA